MTLSEGKFGTQGVDTWLYQMGLSNRDELEPILRAMSVSTARSLRMGFARAGESSWVGDTRAIKIAKQLLDPVFDMLVEGALRTWEFGHCHFVVELDELNQQRIKTTRVLTSQVRYDHAYREHVYQAMSGLFRVSEIQENFFGAYFGGSIVEPDGVPALAILYRDVWHADQANPHWANGLVRASHDLLIAKTEQTSPPKLQETATEIARMVRSGVVAVNKATDVSVHEKKSTAAGMSFKQFFDKFDERVGRFYLGHVLVSQMGNIGSFAAMQAAMEVANVLVNGDTKRLVHLVNAYLTRAWKLLSVPGRQPQWVMTTDTSQRARRQAAVQRLYDMGERLSPEYLAEVFDVPVEAFRVGTTAQPRGMSSSGTRFALSDIRGVKTEHDARQAISSLATESGEYLDQILTASERGARDAV